jgi:SAM-dependent methyltransferase
MTVHESASRGFGREADAYERGRPEYPRDAIEWLASALRLHAGSVVADVGAGTGKLTRALTALGVEVTAIEPVLAMRQVLSRELPAVEVLDGSAEALPLADASVDAIVVGQAFHWFDAPRALAEFHRVLRPGGRLGLLWNVRDRSQPLQRAIDEITEPLRGDTPSQSGAAWRAGLAECHLFAAIAEHRAPFELELDTETFVDRIGSISFIAALEEEQREAVLARVRELAAEHPEAWAYVTELYACERLR